MNRAGFAVLLAALLMLPLADAASPGARSPIAVDAAVNEVAVASNGRFAAASADPGSRLTGDGDVPTWNLWNADGSLRQSGSVDPATCTNDPVPQPPTEDCKTAATHIALSADGTRIAVVADLTGDGTGSDVLHVFNDAGILLNGGHQYTTASNGIITDVAVSADGSRIAVAVDTPNPQNPSDRNGFLQVFDGSGLNPLFSPAETGLSFTSPVRRVALSPDGDFLSVAAGGEHYFKLPQNVDHAHTVSGGSATDLSMAAVGGWAVAGFDNGYFALYDDGVSQSAPRVYQKKETGADTTGLLAAAIRPDAAGFVTGSSGGTLRYYRIDHSVTPDTTGFVTLVDSKASLGQVRSAAFSGDSRYVAVRSGSDTLRLYAASDSGLAELWKDTRSGLSDSIAVDARGEHVIAATGSSILVYDAVHALTATLPAVTQDPGTTANVTATYRNDGNRLEDVSLSPVSTPTGVSVEVQPASFSLAPGASKAVSVRVGVPSTRAPGALPIQIQHRLADGQDGTATKTLQITVASKHALRLTPDGATSLGVSLGSAANFHLAAANGGNLPESGALRVTGLPTGWKADVDPASITLAPGEAANVTVSLTPPAGAPKLAQAAVRLEGPSGASLELTATVGASFAVRLTLPAGVILAPGVSTLVNGTVRNDGNAPDTIVAKLGSLPAGWQGSFLAGTPEQRFEDLEPGREATVQVTLRPPEGSESDVPLQVTLTARSLGDPGQSSTKAVLVTVAAPTESESSTSGSHTGKGMPGPEPALLLLGLALALVAVRRRTR